MVDNIGEIQDALNELTMEELEEIQSYISDLIEARSLDG